MKYYVEISPRDFEFWGGAKDRMVEDAERGRYEVKVRIDCKFWVKHFDDLGKGTC